MLGLLKTYCDLHVTPQQTAMWLSRMAVKAGLSIEHILQDLGSVQFMMMGLRSVPEKRMASLFFAILNSIKVECSHNT